LSLTERQVGERTQGSARPMHRLLYLLYLSVDGQRLSVCPVRAPLAGVIGTPLPFSPQRLRAGEQPVWLTSADISILHDLHDRSVQLPDVAWFPLGPQAGDLLHSMIETGRCFLQTAADDDRPGHYGLNLQLAEHWPVEPRWMLRDDGGQQLRFDPWTGAEPSQRQLPLNPPWVIDPNSGACHQLKADRTLDQVLTELNGSSLRPDQIARLKRAIEWGELPAPRRPRVSKLASTAPIPMLRLVNVRVAAMGRMLTIPAAELSFQYHHIRLPWDADGPYVLDEQRVVSVARNQATEHECVSTLRELDLFPLAEASDLDYRPGDDGLWLVTDSVADSECLTERWLAFQQALTELGARGWQVASVDDLQLELVEPEAWLGELSRADEGSFDLDLTVRVDGRTHALLPAMINWVEAATPHQLRRLLAGTDRDQALPMRLDDRRMIMVPAWRMRAALGGLLDLIERSASTASNRALDLRHWRLRLPRARLTDIGAAASAWQLTGDDDLIDVAKRLQRFDRIAPVSTPEGLRATLRPYQITGLSWLQFLREFGFGGVLADDMGLGKTIQALSHVLIEKTAGRLVAPALVIAPTSLMFNWRAEAQRFAPELKVVLWHGSGRKRLQSQLAGADLVLTSYPLVVRDLKILSAQPWHLMMLDEAQTIKNSRAAVSRGVRRIQATHRLCLTGTPLENHLGELWSLFDFLMPGLLGNREQFRRWFRVPIEKQSDEGRRRQLAARIRPFFLRRTKADVMPELPDKTEIIRSVPLDGAQRRLYESLRIQLHDKVRYALRHQGPERGRIVVLDALLKLRQVCCDPRLLPGESGARVASAKLQLLMELLPELIAEGRRVLLFSQFVSMLDLIEAEVERHGIECVRLTGQTRNREAVVRRFQDGDIPLFLVSLKAGGVGLNLTAADAVIHYDPWWNPAVEDQATDRAHRIGQDQKVFVYRLLTEDTIEQKVAEMQARKRELIEGLMEGGGAIDLGREDLDFLFS